MLRLKVSRSAYRTGSDYGLSFPTPEDSMAIESEYFPEQTSSLSSLSPEDRSAYRKIAWGLFGGYTAAIAITGVVVVSNANFQKPGVVVVAGTLTLHQGVVRATNVALQPSTDRRR
jgi:hypothetical protein